MDLDTLGRGKYLSLTTYRKDGTPVATPVWLVRDGDGLAVITEDTSGKAKRLRNNPAVLLAPCDGRGKLKGDAVPGTAVLLDHAGTTRTLGLISARYGVMGKVITLLNERRARKSGASSRAGIRITLDA